MNGAELIMQERQRQIDEEGWTPEHDDQWTHGELIDAATWYARVDIETGIGAIDWPWAVKCFKPGPTVRNLVKAGALIAAEIDRLKRQAANHGG